MALWTLWLGLAVLFVAQLYVMSTSELAVPQFLLRRLERKVAESGLRLTFARTRFDPTGRVLVEEVRLSLPQFPEPVVTARTVYLKLDPWLLALGQFEPRAIQFTGLSVAVPAMLSPSGRAEAIVRDFDGTLLPSRQQIGISQLNGHLADIAVSIRGAVSLAALPRGGAGSPRTEFVATQFPRWCRLATGLVEQLDALENPSLHLELAASDAQGALVDATLIARRLRLTTPLAAQLSDLRVVTHLPLLGEAPTVSHLELDAAEVTLPLEARAENVHAALTGRFQPGGFRFEPGTLRVTADRATASGFSAEALSAELTPQPLPRLQAEVLARIMGEPLAVRAAADFTERSAVLNFAGALSPRVLDPLSQKLGTDVRKYFDFAALACEAGEARLGAGWKFEKLTAQVALRDIDAYHVRMEEGRAAIELAPDRFFSPDAWARIGHNFARGSYEHDLKTQQYRFLLDGRLNPVDISGWFREWWPRFFEQFQFPAGPPLASVDVSGFWRESRRTTVFVFADATKPTIRGAAFDRVRTRLFIRPAFFDGLELLATHGTGLASGTFTYAADPETHAWRRLDLALTSNLDPALASRIIGPASEKLWAQFHFAQPPALKLRGRMDGPAAPEGEHQWWQIEGRTAGEFRFHGFPLEDVALTAALHDDDITIEQMEAKVAGGVATGHAKVWGTGEGRRVGFDYSLKNASLGLVAGALQRYAAELNHREPAPAGKFVQEKANVRLDLSASAEGRYADPFSFEGSGNAVLQGAEIGEVPLLGLLSELLKFTALRFTSARANFKIDHAKLAFSEVTLRGANSAIDAHGDYLLDKRELDFKAKLFPFQESESLIKTVVGAVLSPISNVFEVKLTGNLDKPQWAFVIGPTNFLRALAPGSSEAKAGEPTAEKSTPAPAPTEPPVTPKS